MTSLGRCSYEFQEIVTISDLMQGSMQYSGYAISALRGSGVRDTREAHYARICISVGADNSIFVTMSILPYGEMAYTDTISLHCGSFIGLAPVIFAYISGALGDNVGYRVSQRHARSLVEWLKSASQMSDIIGH